MFYLGEYDEDTAKEIKSHLDKAGLKVELKSCLVIDEETTYYIKDKMSAIIERCCTKVHEFVTIAIIHDDSVSRIHDLP